MFSRNVSKEDALHEVGPGWASIIEELYAVLPGDITVVQVKEKFGGLRFYVSGYPDELSKAIDLAEKKSFVTCELCGEKGEPQTHYGWVKTTCPAHSAARMVGRTWHELMDEMKK